MLQNPYLLVDATTTTCDTDVDEDLMESINIKSWDATRISCSLLQFKHSNNMLVKNIGIYQLYPTNIFFYFFRFCKSWLQAHFHMDVDKVMQHIPRISTRTKSIYFI